jgi:MerR family transcriptional regulator, light-induced transcriptional regulator
MREMSARSGVTEGTLRMWESRHDFPVPRRLPSGHRRYSELDLKRVRSVAAARDQGLSLATAIERARQITDGPRPSVFAALRDGFPHLQPQLLRRNALLCLSRAIEDELCARGQRAVVFGCFQHEPAYRAAEPRWRELARTAERTVVLADFRRTRFDERGPCEVPLHPSDPLMREWVVVCEAPQFAACLAGFERPRDRLAARRFETVWTVEGAAVREAANVCCELTARSAPELVDDLHERLADPWPAARDELRTAIGLTAGRGR